MKKLLFLFLIPTMAVADNLTWDPPTQREDGSALVSGDLKEYRVYETRVLKAIIPAPTVVCPVIMKTPKAYIWEVTAVDKNGTQSKYSLPLIITPTAAPTLPPIVWPPSGASNLSVK